MQIKSGRVQISCLEVNGSIIRQHHYRVAPASAGYGQPACVLGPWLAHICYSVQQVKDPIGISQPVLCPSQGLAMALFLNSNNVIIKCNECDKVIQKSRLECDADNHYQGIKVISSSPGLYEMIPSIPETGGCSQPCPTL